MGRKMQKSVRIFFEPQEYKVLEAFQSLINQHGTHMNMSRLCKQAVMYSIVDSQKRATKLHEEAAAAKAAIDSAQGDVNGDSSEGDSGGASEETSGSADANPDTLADSQASGDTPASVPGSQPE